MTEHLGRQPVYSGGRLELPIFGQLGHFRSQLVGASTYVPPKVMFMSLRTSNSHRGSVDDGDDNIGRPVLSCTLVIAFTENESSFDHFV